MKQIQVTGVFSQKAPLLTKNRQYAKSHAIVNTVVNTCEWSLFQPIRVSEHWDYFHSFPAYTGPYTLILNNKDIKQLIGHANIYL